MKKYLATIYAALAMLALAMLAMRSPVMAEQPGFISAPGGTFNGGTINQGLTNNGGTTQVGSTVITAIGTPTAPTVTPITTGSTTAVYFCDGLDINGLTNLTGGVGNTLPSLGTTITNGNATPDTTVTCGPQTGALGYVVTKGATGGATSLLGSCLTLASGNKCPVTDIGQTLTTYTANSIDGTAELNVGSGVQINDIFGRSVFGVIFAVSGGTLAGPTNMYLAPFTFAQYTVSSGTGFPALPATCTKGGTVEVMDATSLTAGACTGGGSDATIAICSAANTWSCL